MPAPILMVHGAFCGGWVFEAFKAPFEAQGHICMAPDLPGHGNAADRALVRGLSMRDYAAAVVDHIRACEEPPVVIGHSLGGLAAQIAATRAPVSGLILLAPSAPWGVAASSMEEAAVSIGLMSLGAAWAQALDPDPRLFSAYSLGAVGEREGRAIFDRLGPESGRALWETFNWWLDPFMTTHVSPAQLNAPVLAIAGAEDRIHPPSSVALTAGRLDGEARIAPNMSHWLIGEPGWRDIARACLEFIDEKGRLAAA